MKAGRFVSSLVRVGTPKRAANRLAPLWRRYREIFLSAALPICLVSTTWAEPNPYTVTSTADTDTLGTLRYAINQANQSDSAVAISFDLAANSTITLTDDLPIIAPAVSLWINGTTTSGLTINGGFQHQVFFVTSGAVYISSLEISEGTSKGGDGGAGVVAGGGALGAGGAIFVHTGAEVTLTDVQMTDSFAQGGAGGNFSSAATGRNAGGGGGMRGANGYSASITDGGDGGGPLGGTGGAAFSDGGTGGAFSGGGGGGGGYGSPGGNGGAGGFGGGGGGGGAGSGGDYSDYGFGGMGGFGAANGSRGYSAGGDGGDAFGGAIFVNRGGSLTLINSSSTGSSVLGGYGGIGNNSSFDGEGGTSDGTGAYLNESNLNLEVTVGESVTYSEEISGVGNLVKSGAGELVLSGTNNFTGEVQVIEGLLSISSHTQLGAATNNLVLNGGDLKVTGDVAMYQGGDVVVSGETTLDIAEDKRLQFSYIQGNSQLVDGTNAGSIIKTGAGMLQVLNTNGLAHTGSTTIREGKIEIVAPVALTGDLVIETDGELLVQNSQFTVGALSGDGTVNFLSGGQTAYLISDTDEDSTFDGTLNGSGILAKAGSGTLIVTGTSDTIAGIQANGGVLQIDGETSGLSSVASGATLRGTGTVGDVSVSASGNLEAGTATEVGTLSMNSLTLLAGANVNLRLGEPEVAGGQYNDFFDVAGDVDAQGATFNITNSRQDEFQFGTYRLIDYGGQLLGSDFSVGTLPGDLTADDAEIQTSIAGQINLAVSGSQFFNGTVTTADGTIHGGSGVWDSTTTNWTNAAATDTQFWESRTAVFAGEAGTVTVEGEQTFKGLQFSTDGYELVAGTAGSLLMEGDGAVRVDEDVTAEIGLAINGAGSLEKRDGGTLVLSGANTYSGGTVVTGGTLQGDTTSLQGDITNNATVVFEQGSDGTYEGVISGTGSVTKSGEGTLVITGASTYTGDTILSEGMISFNHSDAALGTGTLIAQGGSLEIDTGTATYDLENDILLKANLTINKLDYNNVSILGDISESGGSYGLTVTGPFMIYLEGDNTFTGDVSIEGSDLSVTSDNALALGNNVYIGENSSFGTLSADAIVGKLDGPGRVSMWYGSVTAGNEEDFTFTGDIDGRGDFIKSGTGAMTYTGELSNDGLVTISEGKLISSAASLKNHDLVNNAELEIDQTEDGSYGGVISGTGDLVKNGEGKLTISGANTYTGDTTLNEGTLSFNHVDAAIGTGSLIVKGGSLEIDVASATFNLENDIVLHQDLTIHKVQTDNAVISGDISESGGSFGLTKTGPNVLILEGDNTFTGDVKIETGSLYISSNGALARGNDVNISEGAELVTTGTAAVVGELTGLGRIYFLGGSVTAGNENDFTYDGWLDGSGDFIKAGSGAMTHKGQFVHTGSVTVSDGQLIGNAFSFNDHDVINNAEVVFEQTDDGSYGGVMSGTGNLVKSGDGTLTVSGGNSYTGTTSLDGGVLALADQSSALGTGAILANGGNLRLDGSNQTLSNDLTLNADLTVTIVGSENGTLAGDISGSKTLTADGAGVLWLSGDNSSFTGDLNVHSDFGVIINSSQSLTQGNNVDIADGSKLFLYSNSAATIGSLTGKGTAAIRGGALTVGDENDATFDGQFTGEGGSLTKTGSGNLTLTAENALTSGVGAVTVAEGQLIGSTSAFNNHSITNNAEVVFSQSTNGVYSGNLSGTGALFKEGTGSVSLTGVNTYSGDTHLNGGTIAISSNASLGDTCSNLVFDGGLLQVLAPVTIDRDVHLEGNGSIYAYAGETILSGDISGVGYFRKIGVGTLALTGENTYTGGTYLSAGTIKGDSHSIQGQVVGTNGATLQFEQIANGSYGGNFSGNGRLLKTGVGELTLTGTNSYTGGTTVSAGTLIGTTSSLQGSILNNAIVTFDQSGEGTYAGTMSGSGQLIKDGVGTTILSGANTYTGGTTVTAGTLSVTTQSLPGNAAIASLGTLLFDQETNGTYAGSLSGNGTLAKDGESDVTLTGTSTFNGTVDIRGGQLINNGSMLGQVTVGAGSTLSGTGTQGSTTVGGTIAPGNSIGTMNVVGDYTQQTGSTYQAEVNPDGTSDLIAVTQAATIESGANLEVSAYPTSPTGRFSNGQTFTILTATDGIDGVFDTITDDISGWEALLLPVSFVDTYYQLQIQLQRSWEDVDAAANTLNQQLVLAGLKAADDTTHSDAFAIMLDELVQQQGAAASNALGSLSGQLHATMGSLAIQQTTLNMTMVADRARQSGSGLSGLAMSNGMAPTMVAQEEGFDWSQLRAQNGSMQRTSGWISGYGAGANVSSNGNAPGLSYGVGGTVFGADTSFGDEGVLGIAGNYGSMNVNGDGVTGGNNVDMFFLTAYGRKQYDSLYVLGALGYGYHGYDSSRSIVVGGINSPATADYNANQFHSYVEVGQNYGMGNWTVTPLAGLQYVTIHRGSFTESGPYGLSVSADGVDSLRSNVGARLGTSLQTRRGWSVSPYVQATWMAEMLNGSRVMSAQFTGAPNASGFTAVGNDLGNHYGVFGTGFTVAPRDGVQLFLGYDAQASRWYSLHSGMGGVQFSW